MSESRDRGRRLTVAVVVLAGLIVAFFVGAAAIPRWWAQRVGDQVDGSILNGALLGLGYGLVFTLLPLALLVLALPRCGTWRTRGLVLAGALVLALPNLFTLGIVVGTGDGAHAGERTLDVDAPAFRGGSLAGAIFAGGLVSLVVYLVLSRRRQRRASATTDAG